MIKNNYTTLVSCRIDNQTLKGIDKFCEGRSYLKRSSVINDALTKVFRGKDDINIYGFLYNNQPR